MTWCKNHVAEKCAHQLPDQVFPYFFMKSESSLFRQHYITRNHQKAKLTPTPSKKIFSLQYPPAIKTYSHNPHLFTSKYKQCFFWRCGFFMLSAGKCGMSVVLSMFFFAGLKRSSLPFFPVQVEAFNWANWWNMMSVKARGKADSLVLYRITLFHR